MTAADIQHTLRRLGSPDKAKSSAWFFKTGPGQYGEGDQFIGVTVPEQRKVAKQFSQIPLREIRKLLGSPTHEDRLTAVFILVHQYQQAKKTSREYPLVKFYLEELNSINNWDLVDSSAPYILGDWLLVHTDERKILGELAASTNLWSQRVAILATAPFIRAGDFTETFKLAVRYLDHPHDLMHKATGWMLREVGNQNRAALRAFLDTYTPRMPRTMLRYAIEKFPEETRRHYLKLQ